MGATLIARPATGDWLGNYIWQLHDGTVIETRYDVEPCGHPVTTRVDWRKGQRCNLLAKYADGKCWRHSDVPEVVQARVERAQSAGRKRETNDLAPGPTIRPPEVSDFAYRPLSHRLYLEHILGLVADL